MTPRLIRLGFRPDWPQLSRTQAAGSELILNAALIRGRSVSALIEQFKQRLIERFSTDPRQHEWHLDTNLTTLNDDLISEVQQGRRLTTRDCEKLARLCEALTAIAEACGLTIQQGSLKKQISRHGLQKFSTALQTTRTPCILRYGRSELAVLMARTQAPKRWVDAARAVASDQLRREQMLLGAQNGDQDIAWLIRRLCTNAGFYGSTKPTDFVSGLNDWCDRYEHALMRASAWIDCQSCYHLAANIQQRFLKRSGGPHLMGAPGPEEFYRGLDGRRVVLVTAYANAIASILVGQQLPRLFKGIEPPKAQVLTVQAPFSTWPLRPAESWQDSLAELVNEALVAVDHHKADLVIAAAGCYGLPLCETIQRNRNVGVIYLGHLTNSYCGVLTNSLSHVLRLHGVERQEGNWASSGLAELPGVERIDDGRYV